MCDHITYMTSHVGTIPTGLASYTFLCDLPLLFVYFQVNNGVLYFLDYVEGIYITVLSVLVSIINSNHMYLPLLLLTVYCIFFPLTGGCSEGLGAF